MGMFSKLFGRDKPAPVEPMTLQAHPISVNPSSPAQLKRHVGRLANLYNAQAREPSRTDVAAEIVQRQAAIVAFGHVAPEGEEEARALLARMGQ